MSVNTVQIFPNSELRQLSCPQWVSSVNWMNGLRRGKKSIFMVVCVWGGVGVCVWVCVCFEREREREREAMCVYLIECYNKKLNSSLTPCSDLQSI